MELLCEGLDLSDAVLNVLKATSLKTTNPILEGIKLKAYGNILELSATDGELSIIKKIKAIVSEEGETVVPGNFFSNYLRRLTNEQIKLTMNNDNQLKIAYADSEGYIQCYNASEFPKILKIEDDKYFEIKQNDFKTLITKSIFAVAVDNNRPILKGVLLEVEKDKINAVALDGYRLALVKKYLISSNVDNSIIVPSRSLLEISKLLQDNDEIIKVYVKQNVLMVNVNDIEIITRLLEGEFIKYNQIIPNEFQTECIINKNQFESTLERASLLAKFDKNNLVKFDMKESNLLITSNSEIGNIKENLNVNLKGNDLNIAFNARYFMDILKNIDEEFLNIKLNTSFAPCVVVPIEGDEFIYLVLPVRITG